MAFGVKLSGAAMGDMSELPSFLVPVAERAERAGNTIHVSKVESMPAWDGQGEAPERSVTTYTLVKKRGAWSVAAATKGVKVLGQASLDDEESWQCDGYPNA